MNYLLPRDCIRQFMDTDILTRIHKVQTHPDYRKIDKCWNQIQEVYNLKSLELEWLKFIALLMSDDIFRKKGDHTTDEAE